MEKDIKNIISIDIDVMFDCYKYEKLSNHDIDASKSWTMIESLGVNYKPNIDILRHITSLLSTNCSDAKVRVIEEHDEIIEVMRDNNCNKCSMYNLDNHHDITYGGDDSKLSLENWVKFARHENLIDKYTWIHTDMSEMCHISPILYNHNSWKDVSLSDYPKFDLVVICVSHHFTPRKYWTSICNVLLDALPQGMKYFREVNVHSFNMNRLDGLYDYLIDGTYPNINRLFRYKDCYGIYEKENNSMSIVNLGKQFNIQVIKEVVDLLLKEYEYGTFNWIKGIKNEVLIKRMLRGYDIIDEMVDGNEITIKFKRR